VARRKRRPYARIIREVLCGDGNGQYEASFFDFPLGTDTDAAVRVVERRCKQLGITPIPGLWFINEPNMTNSLEVQVCHKDWPRTNPRRRVNPKRRSRR
jgi:hypothetical protein